MNPLDAPKKGHQTRQEKYGKDYMKKLGSKGGSAPKKAYSFSDPAVAKAAADKRWAEYRKAKNEKN